MSTAPTMNDDAKSTKGISSHASTQKTHINAPFAWNLSTLSPRWTRSQGQQHQPKAHSPALATGQCKVGLQEADGNPATTGCSGRDAISANGDSEDTATGKPRQHDQRTAWSTKATGRSGSGVGEGLPEHDRRAGTWWIWTMASKATAAQGRANATNWQPAK